MFTVEQRDALRDRLLSAAESDPAVVGTAVTGSHAVGASDQWSDIDLVFGIEGSLEAPMNRWTDLIYEEFDAVHHWDLRSGSAVYRVFLMPNALEADVAFVPAADFGPHGPTWRTVFGSPAPEKQVPPVSRRNLTGLAWHHALHAHICVQRHRWWQAEQWISALRGHILALACLRLGHPTDFAKAAHLLPAEVTTPLTSTLVRSLDEPELVRALHAATNALTAEIALVDPALSTRLAPVFAAL